MERIEAVTIPLPLVVDKETDVFVFVIILPSRPFADKNGFYAPLLSSATSYYQNTTLFIPFQGSIILSRCAGYKFS